MIRFVVKIILCVAVCLSLFYAPLALEIYPDGSSYAGHPWWIKPPIDDGNCGRESEDTPPAPVPEPATLLLFGAGAIGLTVLRKKLKK